MVPPVISRGRVGTGGIRLSVELFEVESRTGRRACWFVRSSEASPVTFTNGRKEHVDAIVEGFRGGRNALQPAAERGSADTDPADP
jgi:ribosome biogenesis protein Nip4